MKIDTDDYLFNEAYGIALPQKPNLPILYLIGGELIPERIELQDDTDCEAELEVKL